MAPKSFLLLATDQTREVVVSNRAADRDGGLRFDWLGLLSTKAPERPANRTDQIAQIGRGDAVPGDVGDDDLRRELRDRLWRFLLLLLGMLRHRSASA
jgi:hypothetical protein